jgi:glucose/arabinose dehydrogenase
MMMDNHARVLPEGTPSGKAEAGRGQRRPGPRRFAVVHGLVLASVAISTGCQRKSPSPPSPEQLALQKIQCDPDNGGLTLPPGFCAVQVADYFANLRGLAVGGNGNVYGAMINRRLGIGGLVALRDDDGDGRADSIEQFGDQGGVGLEARGDYLYLGTDTAILRYRLDDALVPAANPEVIVDGLPPAEPHASKTMAFDDTGGMYVSVGAPSNACQEVDRSPGAAGQDPCPQLDAAAGIWRFQADTPGQSFVQGEHYASGIRHALAIDWQATERQLYVVQHGRDQLSELWPQYYTAEQGNQLPAEEMLRVTRGAHFSWPYCYYDPQQRRRVLAPEYGGDGMRVGRCSDYPEPITVFPAHFGPNDMLFYRGSQFPRRYRGGAFIAFHGAYDRMGGGRSGYQVVFLPTEKGSVSDDWEVFADGFAGKARSGTEGAPTHRPTALAEGPDGSLYVADSVSGRIWRIIYRATPPPPAAVPPIPEPGSAAAIPRNQENTDG